MNIFILFFSGSAIYMMFKLTRSILAPASFFTFIWGSYATISCLIFPVNNVRGLLIIAAFVLSLSIGALLGEYIYAQFDGRVINRRGDGTHCLKITHLFYGSLICFIFGFAYFIVILHAEGYSLNIFFSLDELINTAVYYSVGRYEDTYAAPTYSRFFLPFVYTAPLLGGNLFALSKSTSHRLMAMMTLAPSILIMLVRTEKLPVILTVFFFITSYLVITIVNQQRRESIKKIIFRSVFLISCFIGLLLFAQMSRQGDISSETFYSAISEKLSIAAFGGIYAFSEWVVQYNYDNLSCGVITFMGLADLFGLKERIPGVFSDLVVIQNIDSTNVYTMFRPLLEDFSYIGTASLLAMIGFISGTAYQSLKGRVGISMPILSLFYNFVMIGLFNSIFYNNSVIIAYILYSVVIYFSANNNKILSTTTI